MDKAFEIYEYGPTGGDETCQYYIHVKENVTVQDVIDQILSDKREWGSIFIIDQNTKIMLKYKHGVLTTSPIICDIFNKSIKEMYGHGGWSLSDYVLIVE